MFEKIKLQNEIKRISKEIEVIEKKRYRSQAALVEAILTSSEPNDADVDYFNKYTEEIDGLRSQIQALKDKLSDVR